MGVRLPTHKPALKSHDEMEWSSFIILLNGEHPPKPLLLLLKTAATHFQTHYKLLKQNVAIVFVAKLDLFLNLRKFRDAPLW